MLNIGEMEEKNITANDLIKQVLDDKEMTADCKLEIIKEIVMLNTEQVFTSPAYPIYPIYPIYPTPLSPPWFTTCSTDERSPFHSEIKNL